MLKKNSMDLHDTGVLNKLVSDYLKKEPALRRFYHHFPDKAGYKALLEEKLYADLNRTELVNLLLGQHARVKNASEKTRSNIQQLIHTNTYTVTTGHQLCLFTGPLYFIYKIISSINLAEQLSAEFPEKKFVPVYWMATEDHDFDEVNHFYVNGHKLVWQSKQSGAVGEFDSREAQAVAKSLESALGRSESAEYLLQLFTSAYLEHHHLADATRYLVNELFGEYGLVVVDGNDAGFKKQFVEQFKADLFEHAAYEQSKEGIAALQQAGYHIQVNPRAINCFYLEPGARLRIEKQGDRFVLVGSDKDFSETELREMLEQHPERFSPNVVLRPLYQQVILPNISYIGGPGELAYWLEFKELFDTFGTVFPILQPRNFVSVFHKSNMEKLQKLDVDMRWVFKPEAELIKQIQVKNNAFFDLNTEALSLQNLYETIRAKLVTIDKTLEGSLAAELTRSLNGFERLSGKANRAHRRKLETDVTRAKQLKASLFPGGIPQERHDNFSDFYLSFGKEFILALKKHLDPLSYRQTILVET